MKTLRGFLEALRQIRRGRGGLKVCPRCGKSHIRMEKMGLGFLPAIYVCEDCGYRGHLIVEVDEKGSEEGRRGE
ncbi:hypothetical protein DRO56_03305 [Candidatus Bathyarchaeota archaeon]|nr:MAG: hypothetical protein DRO56_03305 [Candidatus Bathyarchaeota archaeon]